MPHPHVNTLVRLAGEVSTAFRRGNVAEARTLLETRLAPALDRAQAIPDEELSAEEAQIILQALQGALTLAIVVGTMTGKPDKKRVTKAVKALVGVSTEPTTA